MFVPSADTAQNLVLDFLCNPDRCAKAKKPSGGMIAPRPDELYVDWAATRIGISSQGVSSCPHFNIGFPAPL